MTSMDMKPWTYGRIEEFTSLPEMVEQMNTHSMQPLRRYFLLKLYLQWKARNAGVPLSGTFELTPLCNLDCKMCYVHLSHEQMGESSLLPLADWQSLVDQACDAGMLYARVTGGECLTYPDFDALFQYMQRKGVEIGVLTNGLLLTEERIRFFQENPPAYLQVSLYGSCEEAYEQVTGRRAFAQAMEGVRRAVAAEIPTTISITPSQYLCEDAKRIMDLVHQMDLPYSINAGMFAAREETGRKLAEYNLALDDYIELHRYDAALSGRKIQTCGEDDLPHQRTGTQHRQGIGCGAGQHAFSIGWDGVMRGCNVLTDFCSYPVRDGFTAAWQEIHQAACEYPLPVECTECGYKDICKSCVAEHRQGAEKGHASPAICQWAEKMVRNGLLALPDKH